MTVLKDAEAALTGAVGIAMGDAGAIRHFPNSEPAFWRSFAAIAIVGPASLLIAALRPEAAATAGPLAQLGAVVVLWVGFPAAMAFVARLLGLGARYPLFITAYNWSSVLVVALLFVPALLGAGAPGGLSAFLTLLLFAYALWFSTFLARVALETTWPTAIGITLFDALLSLFVSGLFSGLDTAG